MVSCYYYPFGMLMPGRNSDSTYRYGFNQKENLDDVKGEGKLQDFGERIYDNRLSKFLSIDPKFKAYPWQSTYTFAGNNPILNVDVDGLGEENYLIHLIKLFLGLTTPPKNEEEARSDENERNAFNHFKSDIKEIAEAQDLVYGSVIPGYSAFTQYSQKNYGAAIFVAGFDLFGGKLVSGSGKLLGKFIGPEAYNSAGRELYNILNDVSKYYKGSFREGKYAIQEATEDFTVYRISGGKSAADKGEYFSLVKPASTDEAEKLLNLKATSGNLATEITPVTIKKGQQYAVGGADGGTGDQILIPFDQQSKVVRHLNETKKLE